MDGQVVTILIDIKKKQDSISDDIAEINKKLAALPCVVNSFKIGLLQKVVYGAVALILIAFLTTLLPEKTVKSITKHPAQAETAKAKK